MSDVMHNVSLDDSCYRECPVHVIVETVMSCKQTGKCRDVHHILIFCVCEKPAIATEGEVVFSADIEEGEL